MRIVRAYGEITELIFTCTPELCCFRAGRSRLATAPPTPASGAGD